MKILFLDIDGVLNFAPECNDLYYDKFENEMLPLDKQCLERLKTFVESEDLHIVWTTDWRNFNEKMWKDRWLNPRLYIEALPWMNGRVVGNAPQKMSSYHFHNIKWWLDANKHITQYVIFEDSYFPKEWFGIEKHLVQVDPTVGLTDKDLVRAKKILDWSADGRD